MSITVDNIFNKFMRLIEEKQINNDNIFETSYNTSKILTMLQFQDKNVNINTKLTIHELTPIVYISNDIIECKLLFQKINDKQIVCNVFECFNNEISNYTNCDFIPNNILCFEILFSKEDECYIFKLNFKNINYYLINLLNDVLPKLSIFINQA